MKLELANDQSHLVQIRKKILEASRRDRAGLEHDAEQLVSKIHDTRSRLAQAENGRVVSPLAGLEWFLAVTLWFFNATCWTAWFGHGRKQPANAPRDTVAEWITTCDLSEPQHCAALFGEYQQWCSQRGRDALAKYSFYARLVELGARKFRDGRNGPTKYVMGG